MPMTREQILVEARKLNAADRQTLIEDLHQFDDQELSSEQMAELRRRLEAHRRGESKLIPADQAIRDVLSELGQP